MKCSVLVASSQTISAVSSATPIHCPAWYAPPHPRTSAGVAATTTASNTRTGTARRVIAVAPVPRPAAGAARRRARRRGRRGGTRARRAARRAGKRPGTTRRATSAPALLPVHCPLSTVHSHASLLPPQVRVEELVRRLQRLHHLAVGPPAVPG